MLLYKTILSITFCISAITAVAQPYTSAQNGKHIFERKCAPCHGKTGTKGMFGAKNLRISTLSDAELTTVITNGRNVMPSWKNTLKPPQLAEVITYIKTFRN